MDFRGKLFQFWFFQILDRGENWNQSYEDSEIEYFKEPKKTTSNDFVAVIDKSV